MIACHLYIRKVMIREPCAGSRMEAVLWAGLLGPAITMALIPMAPFRAGNQLFKENGPEKIGSSISGKCQLLSF